MTRTVYQVAAKRWSGGWELHIKGVGVTQSHTLDDAEEMVRDYIALDLEVPEDSFDVQITPELGGQKLGEEAKRELTGVERFMARQRRFKAAMERLGGLGRNAGRPHTRH